MKSRIRSKTLMIFGILAVAICGSSTAFSQTPCATLTLPSGTEFTADEGTRIMSVKL